MKSIKFTIALFLLVFLGNESFAQLSGPYTVGGTTPNYATVQDAVVAVQSAGVSGPVVFNIRPGTYPGKVDIGNVTGVSATNTITFQSENGDSTSVIITDTASATGSNFTFHVFGTDYLIVKQVTVSRIGTNANSTVFSFGSNSKFVQIRNCVIESNVTTSTNVSSAQISLPLGSVNDSGFIFENNVFKGGSIALYIQGQGVASPMPKIQILNNRFVDQSSRALQLSFLSSTEIRGNIITTTGTSTSYRGILLRRVTGNFTIIKNKITGSFGNPLHLDTCGGSVGNVALISNNFIHGKGAGTSRGIYVQNCNYTNFYHNTVNMVSTSLNAAAFYINDAGLSTNLNIKNNVFVNTGGGIAFRAGAGGLNSIGTCDYNDLYVGGSSQYLAILDTAEFTDLAGWQAATLLDSNSVSADPQFISETDLHGGSSSINDLASYVSSVPDDIDGQTRSMTTPDIGADEFTPLTDNIGAIKVYLPSSGGCGDSTTVVAVVIKNFGLDAQTGFSISAEVTGAVTQTLSQSYTGSLISNMVDTLIFTSTINTYSGGTINIKAYTQLAGDQYLLNDTVSGSFIVQGHPVVPTVTSPQQHCGNNVLPIAVPDSGTVIAWYDQPVGGNLLHIGDDFQPDSITTDTTFFVEARIASPTTGCIRITEIQTRVTNFVEIQNLSNKVEDYTGWIVAVSGNNSNINTPNFNVWQLGIMNPGQVLYRTDNSTDNYWGSNLAFSTTGRSWAIILDPAGNIADFVAWNYPADSIQAMSTYINGLYVAPGDEWVGKGFTPCSVTTDDNQRIGNYDNNDSTDWACGPESKGVSNINLSPFFMECGVGACPSPRVPIDITIIPAPTVNLGNDTMIGSPFSITLDAGPGIPSYTWSTGATTQTITVTTHGNYWVTIIDSSGSCAYTDSINILLNVGIGNTISDKEISCFPNPASDKLFLTGDESLLKDARIQITDLEGRNVGNIKAIHMEGEITLDLSGLNGGIYIIRVNADNRSFVKRITVIR
jgi:hypothetical protein